MADVSVTPQQGEPDGVDLSFQTLNASDSFKLANTGQMVLYLKETGAAAANVVIETPVQVGGLAVSDVTIAFAGSEEKWAGPFPRNIYGDTLTVTCDGNNVDMAAVNLK